MNFTQQQQTIIDHIKSNTGLVKVNAVAGAGKTTLLIGIADAVNPRNGMYLAYNKAIATESKKKFPKSVDCRTTHSLAYQATVKPYKLWLGHFTYRDITERMKYENKVLIIEYIKQFCLSEFTSFADFAAFDEDITDFQIMTVNKYLEAMSTGEIQCTHDFYLKYFHILLADGTISYGNPFDLIMLDESGDLNPVTLEIFKLLPGTRKVMVGDQHQNIYTFNHTINCFEVMANEGTMFPMTQSFRVADYIADSIQDFCKDYIDPDMEFKGIPVRSSTIRTKAYIARTNGQLIAKMMELNQIGVKYQLSRPAKQIFRVPLLMCGLKKKGFIPDPEYTHLQDDVDEYFEDYDLMKEMSLLGYIKDKHEDDIPLQSALNVVMQYGKSEVTQCFEKAKKNEKVVSDYTVCSAHSAKGLEFDEVTIAPDMEKSIADIKMSIDEGRDPVTITEDEKAELNLYYVACSRAKKSLVGTTYLRKLK